MSGLRYDVTHGDRRELEVVRDLDEGTARRLVEHELSAGRTARMDPRPLVTAAGLFPRSEIRR